MGLLKGTVKDGHVLGFKVVSKITHSLPVSYLLYTKLNVVEWTMLLPTQCKNNLLHFPAADSDLIVKISHVETKLLKSVKAND